MTATPDRSLPAPDLRSADRERTTPGRAAEGSARPGTHPVTAAARGAAVTGPTRGPSAPSFPETVPSLQAEGPRPRVLGLDLSLTGTGLACPCGEWSAYATKPTPHPFDRLRAIQTHVTTHAAGCDVGLVVVEGLSINSKSGQLHTRAGLWHLVMEHLDWLGLPWAEIPPATLKKYATGKGNATKPDMRVALLTRLGVDERDDNKVDAKWLQAAGLDHLGAPAAALPKPQRAALDKVTWPEEAW